MKPFMFLHFKLKMEEKKLNLQYLWLVEKWD